MESRRLILFFLILFCSTVVSADTYNVPFNPRSSGFTPTDFTSSIEFCIAMGTDGTSTEALDDKCSTGGSDDATAGGSPGYGATAPSGSPVSTAAVDLNGNSNLRIADSHMGNGTGTDVTSFSFGCWFATDNAAANSDYLFAKSDDGVNRPYIRFAGTVPQPFTLNTTATIITSTTNLTSATDWEHVVGTYNNSTNTATLYVNGTVEGTPQTDGTTPTNTANDLTIGSRGDNTQIHTGFVYECFWADRVLTAEEICEITTYGLDGNADSSARDTLTGGC